LPRHGFGARLERHAFQQVSDRGEAGVARPLRQTERGDPNAFSDPRAIDPLVRRPTGGPVQATVGRMLAAISPTDCSLSCPAASIRQTTQLFVAY
jgi:hypothetical protein